MTYIFALLAGLVGAAVGWAAAAMIGIGIAGAIGMADPDGAARLFALFGVGPLGGVLGLILGITVALRHRGYKRFRAIAARALVVVIAVGGLAAGAVYVFLY